MRRLLRHRPSPAMVVASVVGSHSRFCSSLPHLSMLEHTSLVCA